MSDDLLVDCDGFIWVIGYRSDGCTGVPCTPFLIFATEVLVNQDIDGAAVESRSITRGTTFFEREVVCGVVYFGHCAAKLSI